MRGPEILHLLLPVTATAHQAAHHQLTDVLREAGDTDPQLHPENLAPKRNRIFPTRTRRAVPIGREKKTKKKYNECLAAAYHQMTMVYVLGDAGDTESQLPQVYCK